MSTSPDDLVLLLSRWLAAHAGNDELRRSIAELDRSHLEPEQAEAVEELRAELDLAGSSGRSGLQMVVRETLEALALG